MATKTRATAKVPSTAPAIECEFTSPSSMLEIRVRTPMYQETVRLRCVWAAHHLRNGNGEHVMEAVELVGKDWKVVCPQYGRKAPLPRYGKEAIAFAQRESDKSIATTRRAAYLATP